MWPGALGIRLWDNNEIKLPSRNEKCMSILGNPKPFGTTPSVLQAWSTLPIYNASVSITVKDQPEKSIESLVPKLWIIVLTTVVMKSSTLSIANQCYRTESHHLLSCLQQHTFVYIDSGSSSCWHTFGNNGLSLYLSWWNIFVKLVSEIPEVVPAECYLFRFMEFLLLFGTGMKLSLSN